MNGEYIITPGQVYHTPKQGGDRFSIDNQNKITYKQGNIIEGFDNLIYNLDYPKTIKNGLDELGSLENEKGNFTFFKNKHNENIYLYNSLTPIEGLDNHFIYSHLLFEAKQEQIVKKTQDFCNFVLSNNIKKISNLAKLDSIHDKAEFIQNIENHKFIDKYLDKIDDRLMEDIFLLGKGCHIGYYGKLYLYAFIESGGKLIPIYFNYDSLDVYDMSTDKSYDKIDIIMKMEGKNKVSLFLMKILDDTMLFKQNVILENELQLYYNSLFTNINT